MKKTNRKLLPIVSRMILILSMVVIQVSTAGALQIMVTSPPEMGNSQDPWISILPTPGSTTPLTGYSSADPFDVLFDMDDDGIFDWEGRSYCVDLLGYNTPYQLYEAEIEPIDDYANMEYVAWLMDNFSTGFNNGYSQPLGEIWESEVALQLAIWEVIYDMNVTGTTVTFGNRFISSGPTATVDFLYSLYLDEITGLVTSGNEPTTSPNVTYSIVTPLENKLYNGLQKMIVAQPTPTPEPATLLLMGCGLLGIAGMIRRQRESKD